MLGAIPIQQGAAAPIERVLLKTDERRMRTNTQRNTIVSDHLGAESGSPVRALLDEHEPTRPRVLVAEPRPELRLQIGHALRQAGMDADFATSADEAQRMVKSRRYDVAVLNPDMDTNVARSLCRTLARGAGHAPTPVITLSDRATPMSQVTSLMCGAQACLVRPLSSERFVGTVWRMARGNQEAFR
jgi:CheY-like chemotaxis protein